MTVPTQITATLFIFLVLCSALLATTLQGVQGEAEVEGPSESECRPYIEKALKQLEIGDTPSDKSEELVKSDEDTENKSETTIETTDTDDSKSVEGTVEDDNSKDEDADTQDGINKITSSTEIENETEDEGTDEQNDTKEADESGDDTKTESDEVKSEQVIEKETSAEADDVSTQDSAQDNEKEIVASSEKDEEATQSTETGDSVEEVTKSTETGDSVEEIIKSTETDDSVEEAPKSTESTEVADEATKSTKTGDSGEEATQSAETIGSVEELVDNEEISSEHVLSSEENVAENITSKEDITASAEAEEDTTEVEEDTTEVKDTSVEVETETVSSEAVNVSGELVADSKETDTGEVTDSAEVKASAEEPTTAEDVVSTSKETDSAEQIDDSKEAASTEISTEQVESAEKEDSGENIVTASDETSKADDTEEEVSVVSDKIEEVENVSQEKSAENVESVETVDTKKEIKDESKETEKSADSGEAETADSVEIKEGSEESAEVQADESASEEKEIAPEEELIEEIDIPTNLRSREHVYQILQLNEESTETDNLINKAADITLRELKRLYENAIKPLEVLYKYRDLSNRHFGDSEIFSKPLVLFMGPWSGGKSSIINYLLDNEYKHTSLRTGAEPSPAYFNILMWGQESEVLDGTQMAADWTFSGLQKFGQGLEERLRGHKLPSKLLEKINIVEIPGILEVRKQVSRVFPFNDACQWFIDRADIIFLVYDPSKLDVGPETEAILDQLKGREYQTRIVLNKADQVKPEELMRVQGALIWNISPLMSSAQPPVMYTASLWSRPYESTAPTRLLQAQEKAFLRDLKTAIDKRIENKIASARRFAVRVRNHAKMVDCYLTTYYNHKSVFGNKKLISDQIIEHPQDYHIYEGLSTLTNISRYDLPDPDVYRDFFRLNALYDFQQLSATCTYFRGCPINRLDMAIAYDLPELVGKYKKMVENALSIVADSKVKS